MTATDPKADRPDTEPAQSAGRTAAPRADREQQAADARRFIADMRRLYTAETGRGRAELAVLRRNAGNTLAEARGADWFYGYLNRYINDADRAYKTRQYQKEETYFLVATLYAFDKTAQKKKTQEKGVTEPEDLGHALRHLRPLRPQSDAAAKNEVSDPARRDKAERRLGVLLDAQWDENGGELAFRLRQTIKLLLSQGVVINWPLLVTDLLDWSQPSKPVQKRWARSFYDVPSKFAPDDADAPTGKEMDEATEGETSGEASSNSVFDPMPDMPSA